MIEKCPCGSNQSIAVCCELIISGQRQASSPEELMRSRYTAFTQANIDYIQKSMTGVAAEDFDAQSVRNWAMSVTWLGLVVKHAYYDHTNPNKGFVEFEATFRDQSNKIQKIREVSEFSCIENIWYYTDGTVPANNQSISYNSSLGRNELCHCNSGKKFKKCCYRK